MFREYVKASRERKETVKVFLVNGGSVVGVIDQIGPEAIVLVSGQRRILCLKSGITSITPHDGKKREG